jgi:hypothetical protein
MTELRYASGLFNLMRNLGGAIGIAVVNTWLGDNTRLHVARMGERLGEAGRVAPDFMAVLAAKIGEVHADQDARPAAPRASWPRSSAAAMTLAFNDVFRLMSWIFLGPWSWSRSAVHRRRPARRPSTPTRRPACSPPCLPTGAIMSAQETKDRGTSLARAPWWGARAARWLWGALQDLSA